MDARVSLLLARLLDPNDLGLATTPEMRDVVRFALGKPPAETNLTAYFGTHRIELHNDGSQPEDTESSEQHYDDYAVDCFAAMMKAKLAKKRAEGYDHWYKPEKCSVEYLRKLLHEHISKGDPVDVANLCMMLRHYDASTTQQAGAPAIISENKLDDMTLIRLRGVMCLLDMEAQSKYEPLADHLFSLLATMRRKIEALQAQSHQVQP